MLTHMCRAIRYAVAGTLIAAGVIGVLRCLLEALP
jgi:hypothetical protein